MYDCHWGTDAIRVIVAGQLPREPHNAPLHLFSASPELVGFGQSAYERRSDFTSTMLGLLFKRLRGEGFTMSYTMEDFKRDMFREYVQEMTPKERQEMMDAIPSKELREMLDALPAEKRLEGLSEDEIRQYLERLSTGRRGTSRKPRRKA